MADERKLMGEVARGEDAERVLSNPVYQDAWAHYEASLLAGWRASAPTQTEEREAIWMALRTIERVKNEIEQVLFTGKMAAKQLKDLKS